MSFLLISPRIYRDTRTGNLYERPTIQGKPTWRKLKARTLKLAKDELAAKRTDQARAAQGLAKDPYAPKEKTIGQLCAEYIKAGCPDRSYRRREGASLAGERERLERLLPFWSKRMDPKPKDCAAYYGWRKRRITKGDGGQAIDMELMTLSNVFHWAVSVGKVDSNPLATRPRFRNQKTIRHCRESMPVDGDELHALAAHFFSNQRSEAVGWQLLIEAMTGMRTSEVLRLRWDAKRQGEPGFIEGDWLWIARSKGGVKPFVQIHPALAEAISALKRWHSWRHPRSKWWLPSPLVKGAPLVRNTLTHGLKRVTTEKRTSHGLRAYYVTVRRSQGISDAQIADEIGDKSGASIIVETYGSVPPNWRGSAALSWLPTKGKPAWDVLRLPENVIPLREHRKHF